MRNSRLVVFVVAALAATASFAGAQARTTSAQRAGQGVKRQARAGLLRGVALTPAEKSRLEDVRGRYRAETKALRESMKPVKQRQTADLRAALSPEHQKQFDANVRQLAERRASAKKGRGKAHVGRRQAKAQTLPTASELPL